MMRAAVIRDKKGRDTFCGMAGQRRTAARTFNWEMFAGSDGKLYFVADVTADEVKAGASSQVARSGKEVPVWVLEAGY